MILFYCLSCGNKVGVEIDVYKIKKVKDKDEYFITVDCPYCGEKQDVKVIK